MAENNPKTQSPEIKEPTTKLQKIETHENQNGNNQSFNTVSFFKVKKHSEKAVIPSRGSLLSAGYDLSRFFQFLSFSPFKFVLYFYCFEANFVGNRNPAVR